MREVSKRILRNRIILAIVAAVLVVTITTGLIFYFVRKNKNEPVNASEINSEQSDISSDIISSEDNMSSENTSSENASSQVSSQASSQASSAKPSSPQSTPNTTPAGFPTELPSGTVECAVVKEGYVELSPYGASSFDPQGINYALPRGTQDAIVSKKTVTLLNNQGQSQLLTLRSGKVVLLRDCTIKKLDFGGPNKIKSVTSGASGNVSVVKVGLTWNSPFDIVLNGSATSPSQIGNSYNFSAKSVSIIVDYVSDADLTKVTGSFSGNSIFTGSPKIEKIHNSTYNLDQYKITYTLKNAGRYFGCHASFEGNTLVLKFNNPPTQAGTLKGLKIGIDPGHGGSDSGAVGLGGKDTYEKVLNLGVATKLKAELEKRGATVYMVRTSDQTIDHLYRKEMAQAQECNLFISVHQNSTGESVTSAFGSEVHFTTPFSSKLASSIQAQIGPLNNSKRGTSSKSNFTVCRGKTFPSVLIECGFINNRSEYAKLINKDYQQKEAVAIANGIVNYYK